MMDKLYLRGENGATFSASTLRFAGRIPWAPGGMHGSRANFDATEISQVADAYDVIIAPSGTEHLFLQGGTNVKDFEGRPLSITGLKYFHLVNVGQYALTIDTTVTNGFVALFSDAIELQPGNALGPWWHPTSAWDVDDTHCAIDVVAGASGGKFSIVVGGDFVILFLLMDDDTFSGMDDEEFSVLE